MQTDEEWWREKKKQLEIAAQPVIESMHAVGLDILDRDLHACPKWTPIIRRWEVLFADSTTQIHPVVWQFDSSSTCSDFMNLFPQSQLSFTLVAVSLRTHRIYLLMDRKRHRIVRFDSWGFNDSKLSQLFDTYVRARCEASQWPYISSNDYYPADSLALGHYFPLTGLCIILPKLMIDWYHCLHGDVSELATVIRATPLNYIRSRVDQLLRTRDLVDRLPSHFSTRVICLILDLYHVT